VADIDAGKVGAIMIGGNPAYNTPTLKPLDKVSCARLVSTTARLRTSVTGTQAHYLETGPSAGPTTARDDR
jgi:hypothetical protein